MIGYSELIRKLFTKDDIENRFTEKLLIQLGEDIAFPLIDYLIENEDCFDKDSDYISKADKIGEILTQIGEKAVDPLLFLLKSEKKEHVFFSGEILANIKSSKAIEPLLDLIYNSETVSFYLLENLTEYGEIAIDPIIKRVTSEKYRSWDSKIMTIELIDNIHRLRGIEKHIDKIKKIRYDDDSEIRKAANKAYQRVFTSGASFYE